MGFLAVFGSSQETFFIQASIKKTIQNNIWFSLKINTSQSTSQKLQTRPFNLYIIFLKDISNIQSLNLLFSYRHRF